MDDYYVVRDTVTGTYYDFQSNGWTQALSLTRTLYKMKEKSEGVVRLVNHWPGVVAELRRVRITFELVSEVPSALDDTKRL